MQKQTGSPSKSATIKDVAREAGVSITTVSNVLNARTGAMSAATLAKVREVMTALAYRPSGTARSLVTGRAASIAVITAGTDSSYLFPAISILERFANEASYGITLLIGSDKESLARIGSSLQERQVAGAVILCASAEPSNEDLRFLLESQIPAVVLNGGHVIPDGVHVAWDDAGGVGSAVAHLVELGHRRIAYLEDAAQPSSSETRRQGYLGAMADHGLRTRDEWVKACSLGASRDRWRKALTELVSAPPRPTAAIAASDAVAAVAMRELQRMGVRVPADFAMIGVGGTDFAPLLSPPLTTVRLPVEEAGRCAAEMLLEMIAGGQAGAGGQGGGQRVMLPCPLVVRESCGAGAKTSPSTPEQPILQRPLW